MTVNRDDKFALLFQEEAFAQIKKVKVEVIIPTFNRPATLFNILKSGIGLNNADIRFVILDDGSTLSETVSDLGELTVKQVVDCFDKAFVRYLHRPVNDGLASATYQYYKHHCLADYTIHVTDKDEFLNNAPIVTATLKLDSDPKIMMVQIPISQWNGQEQIPLDYNYSRISGAEFIKNYVRDTRMQHAGISGLLRASKVIELGLPRILGLRGKGLYENGLEDAFGMDLDILMNLVAAGDVDFVNSPHLKQNIVGGATAKFPLSFAFCYYQYAKRVMHELLCKKIIEKSTMKYYFKWWLLILTRGLVVVYQPSDFRIEKDESRVSSYIHKPVIMYLLLEHLRYQIVPDNEARGIIKLYFEMRHPRFVQKINSFFAIFIKGKSFVRKIKNFLLRSSC